ncbi:hypothetical protein V6N12_064712 [Hibiscus sabdariffa]|uniref:Uncharacterized protein n=1 Tax=Hibiscus sabdariffa TaxID=183260 RepID=A0ABR2G6X4_9ROSI
MGGHGNDAKAVAGLGPHSTRSLSLHSLTVSPRDPVKRRGGREPMLQPKPTRRDYFPQILSPPVLLISPF